MSSTEQEIAEARYHARHARRVHVCQCGDDLPGNCPGPQSCPLSDYSDAECIEDDAEFEE